MSFGVRLSVMKQVLFYRFFLMCLVFLYCEGCTKSYPVAEKSRPGQVTQNPVTVDPVTVVRTYLALGDSYTIGEGVSPSDRYPAQAAALIVAQGRETFSPVQYIAQTGWTTTDLSKAIASQILTTPFDLVTLMIGVNDQYQLEDTTGYRDNFTRLINTSVQLAGNRSCRVIVLSIPDYGVTLFGSGWPNVGKQIDEFNAINQSVTLSRNITYLDITAISRQAASSPGLILGEGPHFTGAEYALWAVPLANLMNKALKN